MRKRTLIILVGLPASGKSTLRDAMANYVREMGSTCTVISSDDYIEAEAAKIGKTYTEAFSQFADAGRRHCNEQMALAMAFGHGVIIWDQTNLTAKKRASIANRVSRRLYNVGCIWVSVEDDVLATRLKSRPGKEIPDAVIEKMRADFERPNIDEGFDWYLKVDENMPPEHVFYVFDDLLGINAGVSA